MNSPPPRSAASSSDVAMSAQGPLVACLLGAALALIFTVGAASAQSQFEEDFDDPFKPWQEVAIQLPAAPQAGNLLPFYASATATQTFEVDTQSLSIGPDGVVRYTLVATSSAGASNVSYEGIRCSSFEKKLYAFGRPDGSWSRSRQDQWQRINQNLANRHHAALAREYFCQEATVTGSVDQILSRLRAR